MLHMNLVTCQSQFTGYGFFMNIKQNISQPLFLADNLALDFINTEYGTGDARKDFFEDDHSVINWLATVGLVSKDAEAPSGLLTQARQLRNEARTVIHAAMRSVAVDLRVINKTLEEGHPVTKLLWDKDSQKYHIDVKPDYHCSLSLLWPVAHALVILVTSNKFEFVRQCEAHDCILLFHDLSKSHRRRWCSMATCGNRMKVAAFRNRARS